MLDLKTAALTLSWLMGGVLVRLDEGIPGEEEVDEIGFSWLLASDCSLACSLLGLSLRWFEYFTGTSLTLLSDN